MKWWWCVQLLQVLVTSSVSPSPVQSRHELCASISTPFPQQIEQDGTCKVPKHLTQGSKKHLFNYVLFQHLDSSISDDILSWYRYCVHYDGIHAVLDIRQSHADIRTRSVDYLFVIELPHEPGNLAGNSSTIDTFLHSLQTLVELSQDRNVFHDVWTQFGFIVYSDEGEKLEFVYARDFASEFPSDLRTLLLSKLDDSMSDRPVSTAASSYRTVSNALKIIGKSLQLINPEAKYHLRVNLPYKKPVHVWHRPYSDLHIVTISDLCVKYVQNNGEGLKRSKRNAEHLSTKLSEKLATVPPYPFTLHSFFDPSNMAAGSVLGQPELAVRYPDWSHFKKAATLKALISSEMGDTLQALLLSRGIEYQAHHLQELSNPRYLLNLSPALTTPLGIRPDFPNLCSVPNDSPLGSNTYCSSLHGWTERNHTSKKLEKFEDKVRLSDDYSSDHADIARSASAQSSVKHQESIPHIGELSITRESGIGGGNFRPNIIGQPHRLQWTTEAAFVKDVIKGAEPVTLRGTMVESWPALWKWNMSYLSQNMDTDVLQLVKCTNNFLTFDPDHRTPLKLDISLSYSLANMSTAEFFKCVQTDMCFDGFRGHYYFGSVPESLKKDISPDDFLYHTERDKKAAKQFMWISSAGMITHTHFDQDYNIFVQLVGRKRFTLWSPAQHELMYVYPRVHPMWHKSRVNYRDVDVLRFPGFTRARALQVELGPGDMLYVPPYTWHYVETLTPSVSLSTWSHDYQLYEHMNIIYRHDHKFDLLQSQQGQMFVLRLYLDMMVHDLYGFNETTQFFARLVLNRFSGLEHLFPPNEDDPEICASSVPNKIPTCVHVHGYAKLDMTVIGRHFQALPLVARDVLFGDYVEEITAQVVGVRKMLAFFRYCFRGQEYYVTEVEDSEHLLWEHKDSEESI